MRAERDAARVRLRLERGRDPVDADAGEHALDERQVHAADHLAAALAERRERAVAEHELALGCHRRLETAAAERARRGAQGRRLGRGPLELAADLLAARTRGPPERVHRALRALLAQRAR